MTYCCITILVFVCSCEASFANNVGFRIDNIQVHDIMQLGWLLVMLDQTQSGRSPGYEYLLLRISSPSPEDTSEPQFTGLEPRINFCARI